MARLRIKKLKTPAGRMEFVAERLKLSPSQQQSLADMQQEHRLQKLEMRKKHMSGYEEFWTEILREQPNQATVDAFLEQAFEQRKEFLASSAERMRTFLKELNPTQRKAFIRMIQRQNKMFGEI